MVTGSDNNLENRFEKNPINNVTRGGGGARSWGTTVSGQSVSTNGSIGSPSSCSEQATVVTTPVGDNTFLRLNNLDIHGDDAGSQGTVVGKTKKKRGGQRAVGADKSGRGLCQFSMKVCEKVESKGRTTYNEIVGDDLLMSNPKRVERAINESACSSLLLKEQGFWLNDSVGIASNSSTLIQSLQTLIETAKSNHGRKTLASTNTLNSLLHLIQSLNHTHNEYLLLSLKLLRNLCAGEIANQDSFIEQDGLGILSSVLGGPDSDHAIVCMGMQVLGNVSLAGERHQISVWSRFFPDGFVEISRVQNREICDPLCMILYTCCDGSNGVVSKLCSDRGLDLLAEIVRTTSAVGFIEDWFKILISRICIDEVQFGLLFAKLRLKNDITTNLKDGSHFSQEQAFLLKTSSEIVNERMDELTVLSDFALCVLEIFNRSISVLDSLSRTKSALPTGSVSVDVLGYSLTILRDICARDDLGGFKPDSVDVVDTLLSSGLIESLLHILLELEPPAIIRKCTKHSEISEGRSLASMKTCPYNGFRRDIVAVIGNCAYWRKGVQDEIREKDGILLMLQQCVTDDDNPYLREWGIWSAKKFIGRERRKPAFCI